ncbi:hypothetical protein [Mesorhizobium sp. B1-1-6]|uniref:hypothetical protein n=1 Tax=Mesorhizobium sp. B1-1-6 TaxID=2589978 RepID=UPI001129A3D9|nr:hypothetical protein [Mesorhizobium sp. B1-1-6]TPN34784.1 hypothetical protein FJ979_21605 [Mesorhizobium sp. B1-1-6]
MQYFITLDGHMIAPPFDALEAAKARADEHIVSTAAEVAIDCYPRQSTVEMRTVRYDRSTEQWES